VDDIRVFHRSGQWCPGRRLGEVAAYDVKILPEYQVAGRPTVDRSYLLLGEGIQLTKPAVFEGPVEGWWYVDLVEIEHTGTGLLVHDLYVDLLIPPAAHRYQVLDLDEFADALRAGRITPAQCATVLDQTQQFINRYLRGREEGPAGPAHPFPPPEVKELEDLPTFLDPPPGTAAHPV
jgi:uncharacterized protein DUF402